MTEIVLLRHGETEWDRENRLHGHAPVPLTDVGRDAVETAGRRLAATHDFDRLYAADTLAARETAALVRLAGVEPSPRFESAWRPRHAGVFQGLAHEKLDDAGATDASRTDVDVLGSLPRGGEGVTEGRARVLDRWHRLCDDAGPNEELLVVTHDFPVATVLTELDGSDPVNGLGGRAPSECGVSTVLLSEVGADVERTRSANG